MRFGFEVAAALVLTGMTVPAVGAHEFWVEGRIVDEQGDRVLELDLKVGQMLDGVSLPYIPDNVGKFQWIQGGEGPISGDLGDIPAASVTPDDDTNLLIFHRTEPRRTLHRDWSTFLSYLDMEGLDGVALAHEKRGLPRAGFEESYTRHAKFALVAPDSTEIGDRYLGSPLEIMLNQVERKEGNIEIAGHVMGSKPPTSHQVSIFYHHMDDVQIRRLRTGPDGHFSVTIPRGPVLLNAVNISPSESRDVAWHSDWASLFLTLK